jgi:transposase
MATRKRPPEPNPERCRTALVTPLASRDGRSLSPDKGRAERRPRKKLADLPLAGSPASAPTRSTGAKSNGAKGRSTMRMVALDLGKKAIAYCEVKDNAVVRRTTVGSLETLEPLLGPEQPAARVAIEACREAWFVHRKLTEWGNEVLLVDTTRCKEIGIGNHRRKNDRIDAEVLARAVERGGIPLAHLLSPHRQELRRQLSVRRALIETRTQYVTTIRGIGREYGLPLPSCDAEDFAARLRRKPLPTELAAIVNPLVTLLETLEVQLFTVEQRLSALSAQEPIIAQLTSTPGVGRIVAASFVSVIDDAHRFRNAHQVESYVGLVPSEDSSGGKRRIGAISKKGNSYLRALLVQSAWIILRSPNRVDPLHQWAQATAQRRGKRIAVVAVARKLAGLLWAMWRDGTVYDVDLTATSGARGLRAAAQATEQRATALEDTARKERRHLARARPRVVLQPT